MSNPRPRGHNASRSPEAVASAAVVDVARTPEGDRLSALRDARLLDTPAEPAFDRLTALAQRLLSAPVALVSLVDRDRQFFKSQQGLAEPWASRRETPLSHSFCRHVVAEDAPLVIDDARAHPLVQDNPAIHDLGIVAYLGVPVHSPDGQPVGAVCAIDTEPRAWTDDDRDALLTLASIAESEIRLRAEVMAHLRAEAQYRAFFDASPDAVLVLDPETETVLEANDAACRLYGRTREELDWAALNTDTFGPVSGKETVRRLVAKGGQSRFESVQHRGDETPFEVAVGASLVRFGDRQVVLVVNRDVTERNQAERAVRESEAQFRQLAEALPQLVWTTGPDGAVEFYNERWYAYTGQTPGEPSWNWKVVAHPDDAPLSLSLWRASLANGTPYEHEVRLRQASDGAYRWFITRAEPLRDAAGRIVRWFGTCTDIHDIRDAREALRESEERLRLVGQATNDAVWDWDMRTDRIVTNPAFGELFGWHDQAAAGFDNSWMVQRMHPDDRAYVFDTFRAIAAGTGTSWSNEHRFERADGTWADVLERGYIVRENGVPIRTVGSMLDLTARKEMERALLEARDAAEAVARAKSSLLMNMSHELRTPLTAVIGYAELLAEELGPEQEDQREYVAAIENGGRRLLGTLNSVLDLAQIEAGALSLATVAVDLRAEVEATLMALQPLAQARGLALTSSGPPTAARADRAALARVLTNLVGNSIKFTKRGTVAVDVWAEGESAWLRVTDTGAGIDPDFLPHVFGDFTQGSSGVNRSHEGSGLGLAITRGLVTMMGGEISAASEKGVGSTFSVRLPVS